MSQNLRAPAKAAATPQLPSNKRKATLGDAKVQSMLAVTECCNDLSTARDALYEVHDVLLNYNASKSTRKATANNLMKVLQYLDKAITSLKEHSNKLSPMAHISYAVGRMNKAQKRGSQFQSQFDTNATNYSLLHCQ
jgi:Mg2+ and Co2+ transporter CorA